MGFAEQCVAYYETKNTINFLDTFHGCIIPTNKDGYAVDAPLYQQAFQWFRDKHDIFHSIQREFENTDMIGFFYKLDSEDGYDESKTFMSYQEA